MNVVTVAHPNDFESWLSDRPKWLQTAASQLIELKRSLSNEEVDALAKLCLDEAIARPGTAYLAVQTGTLAEAAARGGFRISSLKEVRGINALKDGVGLQLGTESLAVVYGPNGSGKTGFARLLKQMCGARSREDILNNVFDAASPAPSAIVDVDHGNDRKALNWQLASGALSALRHVHIFDSRTALTYLTEKNEATYEPSRMRFVSVLIATSDRVAAVLRSQKLTLVNKLPVLPAAFTDTQPAIWLRGIKATTKPTEVEAATLYTTAMNDERVATEAALGEKDIPGRLQVIAREMAALATIRSTTAAWKEVLGDSSLALLIAARKDAQAKRKIASEDAIRMFESAPLQGVGQETWMALWQHAMKYSQLDAYAEQVFPYTEDGARCVLCQQQLLLEGRERMSHFQSFVIGGLEADAKRAEQLFTELASKIPVIPAAVDWAAQASLLRLNGDVADQYLSSFSSRAKLAVSADHISVLPAADWLTVEQAAQAVGDVLAAEEKSLKHLQQDGKRKELEKLLLELQAKQWLNENKLSVEVEVGRLLAVSSLDKAEKLTNTAILTKKNGELAEQELDAGYQQRFAKELMLLGGKRLRVRPESKKAGKGKVTFGLVMDGAKRPAPVNSVLSEGEMRIVALAAFLADITGADHRSPFVFDDPISSLDQDFEERVIARLVDLCKSRQVIVFTHRLSLVTLVSDAVKKLKVQAEAQNVAPEVSLRVEHLRRLGGHAGIAAPINTRDLKPSNALNKIRSESIPQLRKLRDEGDVAAYDARIGGMCSDFRIVVERAVEVVLLNGVVLRFRRSLETKGRIAALAKIQSTDCALLDDLMTRYSAFEHSQSDELPAECPDIDDLDADVGKLAGWIEQFGKRSAK